MDFDLNVMPWEEEDDDLFEDVIPDNNVNDDVVNNDVVNEDVVNNDVVNEDVVNDDAVNDDANHDDADHDDNVEDDAPPVVEGGFVQKVANVLNSGGNMDSLEVNPPTQGMSFVNGDEFAAFCYLYAYKCGFQLFIRANEILKKYSDRGVKRNGTGKGEPRFYMMRRIRLCCTMGANPSKKNGFKEIEGFKKCELVIEASLQNDFMVINQARLEHNHVPNPENSRHMVNYRLFDEYFKRRALMNDAAGISISKNFETLVREVGGHDNLPINQRDLRNMINLERRRSRINGDAAALEARFIKLKEVDPDFYYAIETDYEGKLLNVFWADGRCRGMAKSFGDAVSYDATFCVNRYKMPFTPFVGVNHHGSTVVLASALISHENAVSFTWVFRQWLLCMGKAPSVIITDQCKGIGKAVKDVFTNTPHRLCIWHMLCNATKNLGSYTRYQEIYVDLRKVVFDSADNADFEESWQFFIDKFQIGGNSWIKESYEKRKSWVPLYWRDYFCAGMSSTQRSEQTNRFFKIYVNAETTLFKFLESYENALKSKVEEELKSNFACLDKPCRYDKNILVEEVFQKAYTNDIFADVKEEVYGLIHTNAESDMNFGSFSSFNVTDEVTTPFWNRRDKKYVVTSDTAIGEFTCTCKLFEFKGILCRHIIRVLQMKKVQFIPDKYILSRWRKDVVRGYEHLKVGYYTPGESDRLKRSLAVTIKNDYMYRLALHSDDAYSIYDEETTKVVKLLEAFVGIETLNNMGVGTNVTRVWGRRRLQRKENNQRHMVRNATPAREGTLKDPVDKRGNGRAPRPRQRTVRRAINMDDAGTSQPTPRRRRVIPNTPPNTQ